MVPVAAALDSRLGKNDYRVLISLLAHADKKGFCHPRRSVIKEMTGLPENRVSSVTTNLQKLGWLKKQGNGGKSQATRYQITTPQTITETVRVTESVTVTETVRGGVTETVRGGVTETVRGKEQTNRTDHRTDQKDIVRQQAKEAIDYLNKKAGKKFKHGEENLRHPIARLNASFTVEDLKRIVDIKSADWKSSKKMNQYLRPETLFGTKADSYLNQGTQSNENFGSKTYTGTPEHEITWMHE